MDTYPEYDNLSLEEAADTFNKLAADLEEITARKTDLQNRYDFMRRVILPKRFEEKDMHSAKFTSIGRGIRIQDEMFVSTNEETRAGLFEWLADHGEADMIKPGVNSSTLKAYVSRAIKNGEDYPAEFVKVTIVPTARFY